MCLVEVAEVERELRQVGIFSADETVSGLLDMIC